MECCGDILAVLGKKEYNIVILRKRKGISMSDNAAQYKKMTETPVPKLVLRLAGPTILSMLITSIYNLADTYFVGQLSTAASGAVGVVSSLMAIIQAIGFMLGHGAGSTISRRLGAHDTEGATRLASTSFFTALFAGTALTVVGVSFLEPFMLLLGSTDTILPHACGYGMYILLAAPVMMASLVLNNILRYEGKAFFAMIGLVSGGVLNMVLDPVLIFWCDMGAAGAGAATALSQCVSFVLLLSAFLRGKTVSKVRFSRITRSGSEFLSILATGFPSFGRQGLGSIATMLLNVAARGWGDAAVAAMSIVGRIFMFLMSVILGVGQGFQPVAGFNYGAKKYGRVRAATLFTMGTSFAGVCVLIVVCWFAAPWLIRAFRDDPAVYEIALPAFRYQALAMLLQPLMVTTNMLFQSVGKAGRATFLSCCRQGLYFIPMILVLPQVLGLIGVQICQPVADVATCLTNIPFLVLFLRELATLEKEQKQAEA